MGEFYIVMRVDGCILEHHKAMYKFISAMLQTMHFNEHVTELRTRVLLSCLTIILATSICYYFSEQICFWLVQPLQELYRAEQGRRFIFTGLMDAFLIHLKLSCYFGLALSFPYIISQVYLFVAPALYKREKTIILPVIICAPLLFLLGVWIAYFFVMPSAWKFFLSFETSGGLQKLPILLEAKLDDYLNLTLDLMLGFGLAFQLPIVIVLLVKCGIIGVQTLSAYRKYVIVLIFIVAAIMTPPDVISQLILAIPMVALYEISLLVCKVMEKKRNVI